jgi:hypothetical protein
MTGITEYRLTRPDGLSLWTVMAPTGPGYVVPVPPVNPALARHPDAWVRPPWVYQYRDETTWPQWATIATSHLPAPVHWVHDADER